MYNPFRPHLVRFSDGLYGIRKFSITHFDWVYFDLNIVTYLWWTRSASDYRDCRMSLERVREIWQSRFEPGFKCNLPLSGN